MDDSTKGILIAFTAVASVLIASNLYVIYELNNVKKEVKPIIELTEQIKKMLGA